MDQLEQNDKADSPNEQLKVSEPAPSLPQPSSSVLSEPPRTDAVSQHESQDSLPKPVADDAEASSSFQEPQYSAQTESIIKRVNDNAANAAATGTPGWETAREQIMKDMQTSDKFPTPAPPQDAATTQEAPPISNANGGSQITFKVEGDAAQITPTAGGRGRGGGRPRGKGRGGARGSKRKRSDKDEEESEESEVYSPVVTTTKSGRSVQKPNSFVPPPPSPTNANKKKRPYRRNPESAVCKVCLRGTSPTSNMIVFCDGCNTPYHQYCHHPPIDQAVVNEVDKEWYCKQCEKERVAPVPESQIANFTSAEGAPLEQRQRYFASLPTGMLVTLLTKATSLRPDLPLFAPDFRARISSNPMAPTPVSATPTSAQTYPPPTLPTPRASYTPQTSHTPQTTYASYSSHSAHIPHTAHPHHLPQIAQAPTTYSSGAHSISQASGGASHPPMNYMHPSEQHSYGPDVHPPNYPRPGHGLMRTLPPEQEDLQWLVDDDDRYGVFSHMYQVDPRAATNAGMTGMNGGMSHAR